ncbi:Transcriptional regulator containing PAS, AAA-type ATPase, and DNA-binding Fis domains [Caminicella sporogenes DSM 14501]|uniref:Transcriptional regulator containing PAS, AAA-type ATPase, and DNA-binding Fis domains n=1 Tax=Caminicella sporogenes DSM 14501 TaxID=1121266 RepID=A0A1M6R6D4_9FIRM|nr:sigma 54-interacting transcriptional regulator [Caminicella sporogenes]RKD27320.1 Fis family transcriptional regulator [Caminicella sporogenes]SHK28014.1 Transcriptional regulator containing PAS, AAA-type ATPase, and DNA-binding Fis domains [Caminicella sporogenes DSM 14501]
MQLFRISNIVQRIAEAIESVINVDVTIIDNKLNRIAATGLYTENIGARINDKSVFAYALKSGESFIIENPRIHKACSRCEKKESCREFAQVCCPIKVNGTIIGVIGLIAFDEKQKASILSNKHNLLEFLSRMADLLATKLIEKKKSEEIKLLIGELEVLFDSIDRGLMLVDAEGNVLHYNSKAIEILGKEHIDNINKITRHFDIKNIVSKKLNIRNKEFYHSINGNNFRIVYSVKPIEVNGKIVRLVITLNKINEIINVVNDVTGASMEMNFDDIIGESISIKMVKDYAKKAARSSSTVLIQGESGTGKELFARAIHFYSDRRKYPFIPINCAAIPENLLESELFGYEEGAFTGAKKGGKTGKFELANKGTIFLDEIGDMPLHLQTKLLRVLQENMIERVGGKRFIPIDVRIIAATNKNLEKRVEEGEFRDDLYYRLNVIPLYIPPLRERIDDIPILAYKFLNKFNYKLGKNISHISEEVLQFFKNYDWPGNVRELENIIEYAVNMASSNCISINDLPNRIKNKHVKNMAADDIIISIQDLEKREISKAIRKFGRTKKGIEEAAKVLGISRATIYRKLKKYSI